MKKAETKPDAGELRVLILEDNPADAELVEHQLRRAKITFTSLIVEGKRAFSRALADFQPQVILSDFKLPEFDGQAALAVARLQAPDIPFIFVSGSIGEEKAIDLLSQGATDYIFKDNLARLGPAVKRAFAASRLRLEKKATDAELQRHVEEQLILAEAADRFVHINDLDTIYEYLSRMIREISGADYLWLSQYDESRQALQPRIISGFEPFQETLRERFDFDPARLVLYLKDMRPDDFNNFVARRLLPVGEGLHGLSNRSIPLPLSRTIEQLLGSDTIFSMGFSWENLLFGALTVFFKKGNTLKNGSTVEALVNLAAVAIKRLLAEKSLRESERMFATLVANLPGFIYRCRNDQNWTMEYISAGCREITGYAPEDFIANRKLAFNDIIHPDFKEKVWDQLQQKLPRREPFAFEYRIRTAGGAERWVWERGQGVFAEDGSLQFLEGFITDVTARRQAEDQLRESEMKYRALVTQSPDGIFIIGLGGNFLSVNQTMCASLGYSEAEFLAMNIRDIIPERYLDLHRQRLAEIMKGKPQDAAAEYEVKARNGDIHVVAILSAPYYKDNELIGFQGIARDITEKMKMEIRLRESEEYYRTLVKASPDAIIIVDAGGRVTFGSDKTTDLFGIPPGTDIVGVSIFAFVEPAEISRVQERMVEILSGRSLPEIREYRLQRQDRQPFWGEVSSAPLHDDKGRDIGLLLVCRDVSERIRAEEQIRYQASLLQDVSDAIIATDANGAIRMWNRAAETIYGWKTEEARNMPIHPLLSPAYRFQERSEIFEKLGRDGAWSGVIIHHHRDGRPLTIQSSITNLKGPGGEPTGMVSINSDVTERKRAEAEFLREKVFLEKLVETAPEGIVIADNQGRVLKVNSEFVRMFGYDSDEAPGKLIDDLVVPPQYREEAQILNKSVGEGKKEVLESVRKRRDGSLLHVSIIIAPIHIEGEQVAVYAIYQDISERKRAETIQRIQYEIANAMVTVETLFSLFETVRKELSALFDTTNFLVVLYDEASGMLSAPFEKDEKDAISQWPAEKSLTGLVIKQKRSMLLRGEDIQQLDKADTTEQIGSNAEAWLGVPLLINEKVLGAIVVQSYNNADAYDQNSVTIMEIIASQLSAYIKRKQTELELHESETQYRAFFNTSRDCVYITSPDGRWLSMNDAAVELFGYSSREELSQVNISDLYANPEERAKHVSTITELGYSKESPVDLRKKDGTVINALITEVSRYDTDGKVTGFQGTIRDITERKRDEEQIRASLKEKEVLLQEIHHRVKNNLQIISGLLTLQADQAAGRPLAEVFRESQDRIRSIALIHEKLYRSHNLAEIAFDEYLRALTENLFISHSVASGQIAAKFEMEPVLLTIEKAIPLGLIVNELVSNALKHAFPGGRRGEIRISLQKRRGENFCVSTDENRSPACELIIADDGIGMPSDQDSEKDGKLGMKLVSMLSRQLQAELTVKSSPGTEFRLVFPGSSAMKNSKNTVAPEGA